MREVFMVSKLDRFTWSSLRGSVERKVIKRWSLGGSGIN